MTQRLRALRGISLRYKILIPFILLSLVTWLIAADVLGRSSSRSVHDHAESQAREVAESAATQLNLRVLHAGSEVNALGIEARIMVGGAGLRTTLHDLAPKVVSLFLSPDGIKDSSQKDLVKAVMRGRKTPLIDLRRSLLEPRELEDAGIIAAAHRDKAAGQIVEVKGREKAYVVGAAEVPLDGQTVTFMVGDAIDQGMLSTNAIPKGYGLFVVDQHGLLTGAGAPSSAPQWYQVFQHRTDGEVEVGGVPFILTSASVSAPGTTRLKMVAAVPTAPILAEASKGSRQAWFVIGVGGIILVIMALWLTTLVTRPLRTLRGAAQELAAGDLSARADIRSADEIGELGAAFNLMSEQLEKRDTNLREALGKLTTLSETDALTGLYNHRALHKELERELSLAQRHGLPLSVAVIDIDDFKMINDTYGHPTGDHVIRQVAEVLSSNCRREDIVGRHGGDEFMLLLPGTTSEAAVVALEKLRAAMRRKPLLTEDGLRIPIRLSVGTAAYPVDGSTLNELLAQSDAHLYESKRRGGDSVTRRIDTTPLEELAGGGFGMLDSLVTAVDNKDRYTRRHSEDVTQYALLIAEQMGMSAESERVLRAAGLLHDVGKIGVPDSLLRKPALLTETETEIVRHHATLGALVIQGLPDEADIRRAVATHHERWDGTGYPAGLSGTDIPLLGRVLAVADSYSAMTSDRPYRKGLDMRAALEELRSCSGTQFDPAVVDAFLIAINAEGILSESA